MLHSLMESVLTLESRFGFEPSSFIYLASCSFGKPPIPVSVSIFNFGVTLDLVHLSYRVDIHFFKERKNTGTYWALTMHQALGRCVFPILYMRKTRFRELPYSYFSNTQGARIQTQGCLIQKSLCVCRCCHFSHLIKPD